MLLNKFIEVKVSNRTKKFFKENGTESPMQSHYYHPDFYLPEFNLIIEIKSIYTYNYDLNKNLAKKEYSLINGFNFLFMI